MEQTQLTKAENKGAKTSLSMAALAHILGYLKRTEKKDSTN